MKRINFVNSEHSYERLNWKVKYKKPHLKKGALSLGQSPAPLNCIDELDSHLEVNNNIAGDTPPQYVIDYYAEMLQLFEKCKFNRFMSLTKDPKTPCCFKDCKKTIRKNYGLLSQEQQIRYLKELISKFFNHPIRVITEYIVVYEQTKKGQIHAHLVYRVEEDDCDCLAFMSEIDGYKNYQKAVNNINVKSDVDLGVISYLCKIKDKNNPQPSKIELIRDKKHTFIDDLLNGKIKY